MPSLILEPLLPYLPRHSYAPLEKWHTASLEPRLFEDALENIVQRFHSRGIPSKRMQLYYFLIQIRDVGLEEKYSPIKPEFLKLTEELAQIWWERSSRWCHLQEKRHNLPDMKQSWHEFSKQFGSN